eukprot:334214_1
MSSYNHHHHSGGRMGRGGAYSGGGRGEYYKQKYGGGRGRRGEQGGNAPPKQGGPMLTRCSNRSGTVADIFNTLESIDGKPYGTYRNLEGTFSFADGSVWVDSPLFTLFVDTVQADPYADPSKLHIIVPRHVAGFPAKLLYTKCQRVATADFIARMFWEAAREAGADARTEGGGWHGCKGGEIMIDCPGQQVFERTAVHISQDGVVEARFTLALPAQGRTICGEWANAIMTGAIPRLVAKSLLYKALDSKAIDVHVKSVEDQQALRKLVCSAGLVAFVADGSILPRSSGVSDKPMPAEEAVRFKSPESLNVEFNLPNRGMVKGMGIPKGITVIAGGGFHGKSTLLHALEVGIYDHVPEDGRELVVSEPTSCKIRAEDGRFISSVNISCFIDNLPFGRSTTCFSTDDASGSTSQAANIMEALEVGSRCLLVDEDTAATNLMIRDKRMQMLISPEKEPITPYISKARSLFQDYRVSSILVIGSAGDYFEICDLVIAFDCYVPSDLTARAKDIAKDCSTSCGILQDLKFGKWTPRVPIPQSFSRKGKIVARSKERIQFGDEDIDVKYVEQIVDKSQVRAIGAAIPLISQSENTGVTLIEVLDDLDLSIDKHGLDFLAPGAFLPNLARPRKLEIAAAINRYRGGQWKR